MKSTNRELKCIVAANTDWALANFRRGLIKKLHESGMHVVCICSDTGFWSYLKRRCSGSVFKVEKYVKGISPINDIRLCFEYYRLYRRLKPDIIHHFTIKPVIYGSLAARMARVPVAVNTITGLGYIFTRGQKHRAWLRRLTRGLYKISAFHSDFLWFQNEQDRAYFLKNKMAKKEASGVVLGSGVNTEFFSRDKVANEKIDALRKELKLDESYAAVMMVSRILYDKGVREFTEAAKSIVRKISGVKFILVGPLAPGNPSMIPAEEIDKWVQEGSVEYLGRRLDVRELMCLADIVVLPSYREGTPKSLLEAAAMGKPIVTTDTVGCREVVNDGENGLLVPVKNSVALKDAIEKLLLNPKLRTAMGEKSRQRAIHEFDEKKVIAQTLMMYERLFARKGIKVSFGDLNTLG
jgi:glycosyltransferase involved in cell wall biosynthesis